MPLPIERYAVIGDRHTAALVGDDGSIDWLCLPRFDSPACFAALLGSPEHGRWLIGPVDEATVTRRYVGDSPLLETTFTTGSGRVRLLDAMPTDDERADLVRRVVGVEGTVRMRHDWVVRGGYGRVRPWVTREEHQRSEVIIAVSGPDKLTLRGPRLPVGDGGHHRDEFDVTAGDELTFVTTWTPSWQDTPGPHRPERAEQQVREWQEWADRCPADVPHRDAVVRSLVTLRLMSHADTGGIVAAPTTSLPEEIGGTRNWDYRYCWLRDAALTLESLLTAGYTDEAGSWRRWLLRAVAGDPEDLQIMYAVDGGRELPERELDHLPGYEGSTPVRIGNGAVGQRQLDVLGEVMIALDQARDEGLAESSFSWGLQVALLDQLVADLDTPDNGLWEIRGPLRYFTHSRVMAWVALDRGLRGIERHGLDGPADRWRAARDALREEVETRAFDPDRGTFVQHRDTREVDAALLVLPGVGFLPGDDPRMLGTLRAVEEDLLHDGLLLRYRTSSGVDGVSGSESPFLACSFWLVSAYAAAGRRDDAEELMERLVALANDVGLLAEEYDPRAERMLGNFPQAFSHLALVRAAFDLRRP
ncbi:glycoside hydrolase family 15 protein [Nocardioides sp.]|uniref:glycoside hydrolase family 15 protein n=1 Tax=Nocardioides sp. TaxID=35761 RepID=UPI003527EA16